MSVIADLPDIRPSLLLDFANSRRVHPLIQCMRASTATCYGPDGVLRTVASNVPRIDFDLLSGKCLGLLVEEARTNLLLNSVFAGAASGSPGTAPTNFPFSVGNGSTEVIPAGIYTSLRLTTSTAARHFLTQLNTPLEVGQHVFSLPCNFYVASSVGNFLSASAGTAVFTARYFVDGVEIASGTSVGTGKKTVSMLLDVTTAGTISMRFGVGVATSAVGDVEFSLPQLEKGAFPTSPILTTTAAATRAADSVTLQLSSPVSAGALVVAATPIGWSGTDARIVSLTDGTTANCVSLHLSPIVNGSIASVVTAAGNFQYGPAEGAILPLRRLSRALTWGKASARVATNGVLGTAGGSITLPAPMNRLDIGNRLNAQFFSGHIERCALYAARITDSQLQRIAA